MKKKNKVTAQLNDELRQTFNRVLGKVIICNTIFELPSEQCDEVLTLVQQFENFATEDETRAKGQFEYRGKVVCWDIFCFDRHTQTYGEGDPSNSVNTGRTMHIWLAEPKAELMP